MNFFFLFYLFYSDDDVIFFKSHKLYKCVYFSLFDGTKNYSAKLAVTQFWSLFNSSTGTVIYLIFTLTFSYLANAQTFVE